MSQFLDRFDGPVIHATACLLTDSSNFAEHFYAIARHVDFASGGVIPTHWNFLESQTRAITDIKQLHIETKTIDCRPFNNRTAGTHTKSFETTLRVPEGKTSGQSHCQIEHSATLFTAPRLVNANQATIKRP